MLHESLQESFSDATIIAVAHRLVRLNASDVRCVSDVVRIEIRTSFPCFPSHFHVFLLCNVGYCHRSRLYFGTWTGQGFGIWPPV